MSDFNVRSDSVNVEQVMEQIRSRIREKRGVDYTEQQIQELANVKLERFLDPRGVRSDLLDEFRRAQPAYAPPDLPNYAFEEQTLFESHRLPLRLVRRLLQPLLKLFFNPNPLIQALNIQSRLNTLSADRAARNEAARRTFDSLHYEVMHNLVVETTRMGIEVKNLKMRVESLTSRLEFNERRARALESVVAYQPASNDRPEAPTREVRAPRSPRPPADLKDGRDARDARSSRAPREGREAPDPARTVESPSGTPEAPREDDAPPTTPAVIPPQEGPGQRSRRRRRRRGRRGSGSAAALLGAPGNTTPGTSTAPEDAGGSAEGGDAETPGFEPGETDRQDSGDTDPSDQGQ